MVTSYSSAYVMAPKRRREYHSNTSNDYYGPCQLQIPIPCEV